MGTFNKISYISEGTSYGTNAAGFAAAIAANTPGLALHYTKTNTTGSFCAYYSVFGSTDVLICMENSSSTFYIRTYYNKTGGSTTVSGKTYNNSYMISSSSLTGSMGDEYIAYGLSDGTSILAVGFGSAALAAFKATDVCSGKSYFIATQGDLSAGYGTDGNGAASYVRLGSVLATSVDNGYIRVTPVTVYSDTSTLPLVGYPSNADVLYKIYANGSLMTGTAWTEINVAGHKFVSMSSSSTGWFRIS